jgi:hypothetical protein
MTDKEEELLFTLMRLYNNVRTDYFLLLGLALKSAQSGEPMHDVFEQLEVLRQSPYHQSLRQQTEQLLSQFHRGIDEDALIEWIGETPKDKLPN